MLSAAVLAWWHTACAVSSARVGLTRAGLALPIGSAFEVPASRRHHRRDEPAAKGLNRCEAGQAGFGEMQKLVLAATGQRGEKHADFMKSTCQSKAVLSLPNSAPFAHGNHGDDLGCSSGVVLDLDLQLVHCDAHQALRDRVDKAVV